MVVNRVDGSLEAHQPPQYLGFQLRQHFDRLPAITLNFVV